jgi:hypothetical protein
MPAASNPTQSEKRPEILVGSRRHARHDGRAELSAVSVAAAGIPAQLADGTCQLNPESGPVRSGRESNRTRTRMVAMTPQCITSGARQKPSRYAHENRHEKHEKESLVRVFRVFRGSVVARRL